MQYSSEVENLIKQLSEKYHSTGQNITSYLEGLLYKDYLTYWDYIQQDTLLSLQKPITQFEDELIFITYHQITELYFKLCIHELDQIRKNSEDPVFITDKLDRINRYFKQLIQSFLVLTEGMSQEQFRKFRMSLLPASGFQSVQYRLIEIASTDFIHLVHAEKRNIYKHESSSIVEMYENIYWKYGANVQSDGSKSLTLELFEKKYDETLIRISLERRSDNLLQIFKKLDAQHKVSPNLLHAYREYDANININWPLAHYRSAVRHLQEGESVTGTGGTNWQNYLPPRFQKRIFFPDLWSQSEVNDWGRGWVESHLV